MAVASLFEDLLDQYKIEQHIAEKRYTDLFQAYDVDDDRPVRLEVLRAPYAEDGSFAGRFINRARALTQVRHPNIAQVLHIGKADSAPYVAQEEIDGSPLSYRLEQLAKRDAPVHPIYALKLVRQLAEALLWAERLDLFHYDLQPDNIILKNVALPTDDTVTLIDLFIPTEKIARSPATEQESAKLDYLSPEQRAGREVTAASHVYSLGAILYRMLAGRLPQAPVTLRDGTIGRIFGRSTGLERERDGLTEDTYELIDRCLQKDPRRRYADIEAFVVALEIALKAEENLSSEEVRRSAANAWRLAWLLPLIVLVLLAVSGITLLQGMRVRAGASGIIAATTVAGGLTESAPVAAPVSPAPLSTPEGGEQVVALPTESVTVTVPEATAAGQGAPSLPDPTATPSPKPTITPTMMPTAESSLFVRVMHNLVNLRHGPGIEYSLFGNVLGGDMLEVLAWNGRTENPWLLVLTADRRIGWIAASVVQLDEVAMSVVPVAATLPPTPPVAVTATPTTAATPTLGTITPTSEAGGGLNGGIATAPPDDTPDGPPDDPSPTPLPEPTRTPDPP
jgi:hypothetical protein